MTQHTPHSPTTPPAPPAAPRTGPRRTVLTGARVVLPDGVVEGHRLTVEGPRLVDPPAEASEPTGDTVTFDLTGHWIVPGFVDLHVHGGGGASFSAGTVEEARTVIDTHRRHGTTTMLASTVTGALDDLARQADTLADLVALLGHAPQAVGTAVDGRFVPREQRAAQPLRDQQRVLLFQPIVGG